MSPTSLSSCPAAPQQAPGNDVPALLPPQATGIDAASPVAAVPAVMPFSQLLAMLALPALAPDNGASGEAQLGTDAEVDTDMDATDGYDLVTGDTATAPGQASDPAQLPSMTLPLPGMAFLPMASVTAASMALPANTTATANATNTATATTDAIAAATTVATAPAASTTMAPALSGGVPVLPGTAASPRGTLPASLQGTTAGNPLPGGPPPIPAPAENAPAERAAAAPPRAAAAGANVPAAVAGASNDDAARQAALARADMQATSPLAASPAATDLRPLAESMAAPAARGDNGQQALRNALGSRLQLMVEQHSEQARIQLAPPQLGNLDITVRHSSGTLQVQLLASHQDVVRQLQAIGDSLVQHLEQRHNGLVQLSIGTQASGRGMAEQSSGQPRQQPQRQPGRALDHDGGPAAFAFSLEQE